MFCPPHGEADIDQALAATDEAMREVPAVRLNAR